MAARGIAFERLSEWMSHVPARLAGLGARKGRIAPGYDADLVVFDPDGEVTVTRDMLLHRHAVTPYLGATLRGSVEATYVRGALAYNRSTGPVSSPPGTLLLSSHAAH
jgi:allantoinase